MKYVVMLGDGMADTPVEQLGNKTPLEAAHKPCMDFLAQNGTVGTTITVPGGMPPGSDTANLSVMGYNPAVCYTGRSPLEAVSMGITLADDDVTMRCNLVHLSEAELFEEKTMIDYSSDEISTEEARELIAFLAEKLPLSGMNLYAGISYRHCLVMRGAQTGSILVPPHDITMRPITDHLPKGRYGETLLELMKQSYELLKDHPVNLRRKEKGLKSANCCWFWGEGTKPALQNFAEKNGVTAGVISAVDLIKGIGICAGMQSVDVEGATGNINTNFTGKAKAACDLLKKVDLVYIHVEAPDECGHRHEIENKVSAIEKIDAEILQPVLSFLKDSGEDYRILLMPDHPTPLKLRTHTADPVPFVLYDSRENKGPSSKRYTEKDASESGLFVDKGFLLMDKLISGDF